MTTPHNPIPEEQLLAYFEGTLSPDAAADLNARLRDDPAARATLEEWQRQNTAISALFDPVIEEPVPERLLDVLQDQRSARSSGRLLRVAAIAGLLAVGAAGGWFAAGLQPATPRELARDAIGAHLTYVSEVLHPVEVEASEAEHLTGWVSKRLGHAISAPDFAARGFHLIGGRVLPAETGAAALFMYEDDTGRRITLYVAPESTDTRTAFQFAESGGVQSFFWMDGDLNYAVVGDISRDKLRRIALDAYDQLT